METFLSSLLLVSVAEIGDKTQLLSILLAARFQKFWPIFLGIFFATLLNHAVAAWAGSLFAEYIQSDWLWMGTSALFIIIGLWVLIPDKEPLDSKEPKYGAFITSLIAFFIAEMGDKTQLATITLGAQYTNIYMVIIGTTAGMLIANAPAILIGGKVLEIVPLRIVRIIASILFIAVGIYTIIKNI